MSRSSVLSKSTGLSKKRRKEILTAAAILGGLTAVMALLSLIG